METGQVVVQRLVEKYCESICLLLALTYTVLCEIVSAL